jgi:hypothetical protein
MGDDKPANPAFVDAGPDGFNDPGDLAPGDRRQVGQGKRSHLDTVP